MRREDVDINKVTIEGREDIIFFEFRGGKMLKELDINWSCLGSDKISTIKFLNYVNYQIWKTSICQISNYVKIWMDIL